MLLNCGVKPGPTLDDKTPLSEAFEGFFRNPSSADRIATYRCFLDGTDFLEEINRLCVVKPFDFFWFGLEETQWLWLETTEFLVGEDLRQNQCIILRRFWTGIGMKTWYHGRPQFRNISLSVGLLDDIQSGRYRILGSVFFYCEKVDVSYIVGAWFLHWLVQLGIDPEIYMAN